MLGKMHKNTSTLALFFLVLTILQYSCVTQNSPQDYIDAHNAARVEVGVDPLTWDEDVAAFAQNYVNQRIGDCDLIHSTNGSYGENLAKGSGGFTGQDAVELWVQEKSNYNYATNACLSETCGTRTEVTWRDSMHLGCERAQCNDGSLFISCNYDLAKATDEFSGDTIVKIWAKETCNFNYPSNTCVGRECRHYTQVVWRGSVRLGCARAQCNDGWWFISCNYDPPGNYIGQRPY